MKKVITLLFILMATAEITWAQQTAYVCPDDAKPKAEGKGYKIIFQLTTADTMAQKALMKQLANIKKEEPDTKLEVVCHGPGLDMLVTSKSIVQSSIKQLTEKGIQFVACEFSMNERKVEKSMIISEAGFVKGGILEIAAKDKEGWLYIKSGF
jgi:uncharacterized protein